MILHPGHGQHFRNIVGPLSEPSSWLTTSRKQTQAYISIKLKETFKTNY